MALECTTDRDHKRVIKGDAKTLFVPLSKDVIDREKNGDVGTRRVGICIANIASIDQVVEGGSKGTEEPQNRSFDAGGV